MPVTCAPCSTSRPASVEPMNPATPVINAGIERGSLSPRAPLAIDRRVLGPPGREGVGVPAPRDLVLEPQADGGQQLRGRPNLDLVVVARGAMVAAARLDDWQDGPR